MRIIISITISKHTMIVQKQQTHDKFPLKIRAAQLQQTTGFVGKVVDIGRPRRGDAMLFTALLESGSAQEDRRSRDA
jgi:hypothetical protein